MSVYDTSFQVPRPAVLGGGIWHLTGLTDITVVFGKNGSGKSLLLRNLRDLDNNSIHYVAPERTGEMHYEPGQIPEQLTGDGRRNQANQNFIQNYRSQVITRITSYFASRGASSLTQPSRTIEFQKLFSTLLPDFTIELSAKNPPYVLTRLESNTIVNNVQELSSGEAQLATIALDILTIAGIWEVEGRAKRIILIDEPDAHIHPDLQVRFADFLTQLAELFSLQLIVATHSTSLLAALAQFTQSSTSAIYFQRNNLNFIAEIIDDVKRNITACLGGHLLMGPLFGAPLLIVEGDDDFRVWSQVARSHSVSLSALPAAGSGEVLKYQTHLEKLFASICTAQNSPLGYGLLDGHESIPKPSSANPQIFIRMIRLDCHECENLYLTDEVLTAMGTTWPIAHGAIVSKANLYGNKAVILKDSPSWDRKNVDIKSVINEISMIIDSKGVHWTTRIGQVIGRGKPSGMLAAFLGTSVINAFWTHISNATPKN